MASVTQEQQKRQRRIFRIQQLEGSHIVRTKQGLVSFGRNDVFEDVIPWHKRNPDKYKLADPSAPLSAGRTYLQENVEDWDAEYEDDPVSPARMASPQEVVPAQYPPFQAGPQGTTPQRVRGIPQKRFEDMTVNELKSYAEEEEIPLQGATKKEDMIKVIRQAEDE